jgi:hypothetical protein
MLCVLHLDEHKCNNAIHTSVNVHFQARKHLRKSKIPSLVFFPKREKNQNRQNIASLVFEDVMLSYLILCNWITNLHLKKNEMLNQHQ